MNNKYKQSQVAGVAYLEIGALHHQKYNPPPPTCSSITFVMIYKYISHWYPFFHKQGHHYIMIANQPFQNQEAVSVVSPLPPPPFR